MSDIEVRYAGQTILTADESSKYTLLTAGKYCEDDITIDYVKSGGVTPAPSKDVNFVDYDGTILYSYTAAEFAALTELPANPTHDGLVSNGWMYTLAQAKAQAASDGLLYVGHFYNTTDGRTRIKIRLYEGRLSPYLGLCVNGTVTIDWGDDSAQQTITGTSLTTVVSTQHVYASAGDYTIYIAVASGSTAEIIGESSYGQLLWKKETASATREQNTVYASCILEINIGDRMLIGRAAFSRAYHAVGFTYPSLSTFDSTYYAFGGLQRLKIFCLPHGMTTITNYTFAFSQAKAIQIPDSVTSLSGSAFYSVPCLSKIIIPSSVTSIGASCFYRAYGLCELHFKGTTPPTVANSNAWTDLPADCKIYVPRGYKSDYTSEANYPDPNTYTYVEE